jgi:hypothetical protein
VNPGLVALAEWLHNQSQHAQAPAPVALWRLRSPKTDVEMVCRASAGLEVGLELRVERRITATRRR